MVADDSTTTTSQVLSNIYLNLTRRQLRLFHGKLHLVQAVPVQFAQFRDCFLDLIGLLAQLQLVVTVALHSQSQRLEQTFLGLDRFLKLSVLHILDHLHDDTLMPSAQDHQRFTVFLLHRREQVIAQRFHFLADLGRFLHQKLEAHQWQGLIRPADDGTHIQPGCRCPRQHGRIDRRFEQRQLTEGTLDIQTVADFKQAISHCVPIAQYLVIARHTEIERFAQAAHRRQLVVIACILSGKRHQIEWDIRLHITHGIAEFVQIGAQVGISLRAHRSFLGH